MGQRHLCWIMTLVSHICHRSLSYPVHPCNVYAISTSKIAQRIASWFLYFTFPSFKQAYAHNPRRTYKLPIVLTFFWRHFYVKLRLLHELKTLCYYKIDTQNKQQNDICNRKWHHVNKKCFPVEFKDGNQ